MIEYANFITAKEKNTPFVEIDDHLGRVIKDNREEFEQEFPQIFTSNWNPVLDTKSVRAYARKLNIENNIHPKEKSSCRYIAFAIVNKLEAKDLDIDTLSSFFCEALEQTFVIYLVKKFQANINSTDKDAIEDMLIAELLALNGLSVIKLATQKVKGVDW